MKFEGRFARYVISNRTDGIFEVTLRNIARFVEQKNIEREMNVCKNCLYSMISYYPELKQTGW